MCHHGHAHVLPPASESGGGASVGRIEPSGPRAWRPRWPGWQAVAFIQPAPLPARPPAHEVGRFSLPPHSAAYLFTSEVEALGPCSTRPRTEASAARLAMMTPSVSTRRPSQRLAW